MQRKEEMSMLKKAGNQNLAPTKEMQEKGMVAKVVGPRGRRRIILAPLRRMEEVDKEGRVRQWVGSRRRKGAESRKQEQNSWGSRCAPTSGANREPLGHREQGNGQGAAGGGSRREEQERTPASGLEQLRRDERTEGRFQSSGSGEEEGRGREKGRSSSLLLPRMSTPITKLRSAASKSQ